MGAMPLKGWATTGLTLPPDLPRREWRHVGTLLAEITRRQSEGLRVIAEWLARPVRRSRTQTPCWGFRQAHGHESARTRTWRPTHLPVTPMAPPARAPGHKGNTGRYLYRPLLAETMVPRAAAGGTTQAPANWRGRQSSSKVRSRPGSRRLHVERWRQLAQVG